MKVDPIELLVTKAKMGDKTSLEHILNKFTPIIIKYSSNIYLSSYAMCDLIQEGYLYLFNIIKKYNPKKNNFKAYANVALKNNYNYLIRRNAKYHLELSYNKIVNNTTEFADLIADSFNIEDMFIENKYKKALYTSLKSLDKDEFNILIHYYFKKLSLRDYALKNNMIYHHCVKLKNTALAHLKENVIETFKKVA